MEHCRCLGTATASEPRNQCRRAVGLLYTPILQVGTLRPERVNCPRTLWSPCSFYSPHALFFAAHTSYQLCLHQQVMLQHTHTDTTHYGEQFTIQVQGLGVHDGS